MRTWKQGVVGRIITGNGITLFTKCLKYPIIRIYKNYHESTLYDEVAVVFIHFDVLKKIERIGFIKLDNEEKELCKQFYIEYKKGSSRINKVNIEEALVNNRIVQATKLGLINLNKFNEVLVEFNRNG